MMRSFFTSAFLIILFSNCEQEPECRRMSVILASHRNFVVMDTVTEENLVVGFRLKNPKRIDIDSLTLFDASGDSIPASEWYFENYDDRGYVLKIPIFDKTGESEPGTSTFLLYSGRGDYDTIRYEYQFGSSTYCEGSPPQHSGYFRVFVNGVQAKSTSIPGFLKATIIGK